MSIKEILDYVMHTPLNSNKAVLESQLKQLVEESTSEISDATTVVEDIAASLNGYDAGFWLLYFWFESKCRSHMIRYSNGQRVGGSNPVFCSIRR